jgi:HAD superfamily hydrolase (TIGR01484 family)
MAPNRKQPENIALVLTDVDGTLVTHDKVLTRHAEEAVRKLHDRGIKFAITSGRPPKGMSMLFDALKLETPIAGFNGGQYAKTDLSIIEEHSLPEDVAR